MTERVDSMKNGELQFIASDFQPIPFTDKIATPPDIYGRPLHRQALSLYARYWERHNIDIKQIGVTPREGIHKIHKEDSPGKDYKYRHLKENAFARAFTKYAACFQEELRRSKNVPLEGSVIESGVTVTFPDDSHPIQANELIDKIHAPKNTDS